MFCVKNGIKCNDVVKMLKKAFDETSMSTPRIYEWYIRVKEGREDVDDDRRTERPNTTISDENVTKIKHTVLNNRCNAIREVAEQVNVSYGSCEVIFTDILGLKRAAKFVPKL